MQTIISMTIDAAAPVLYFKALYIDSYTKIPGISVAKPTPLPDIA